MLAANVVYILVICGWVLAIMTPFFMILKKLGLFRVAPGEQQPRHSVARSGAGWVRK